MKPSPSAPPSRLGVKNIVISGTNFWNPGDDFVRDGVVHVLRQAWAGETLNFLFYNFNPEFSPQSKFQGIGNFASRGDLERCRDHVDAVVIAGLSAGDEIKDLYRWVIDNGLQDRVYLIGAGYENDYVAKHISQEPEATIFKNARIIIGRTAKTPGFIPALGLDYVHLNCPALLSVPRVKQVVAGKRIERIGFSIQLPHEAGLVNQSCPPSQAKLAQEILLELAGKYQVEVIAHHKTEYFHFLKALQGRNIPVLFSSFYQELHDIYPRYDLVITTRLHASLFANGHGIPGIIVNDTDRHTHTLEGFPHSAWVNSKEGFRREFERVRGLNLGKVAVEAGKFKSKLTASYVAALAAPLASATKRAEDVAPNYQFDSERKEQALVRRFVKPGMTVLDVGANIGKYTKLFSLLTGEKGKVLAFEPSPDSARQIAGLVAKEGLKNVSLFQQAVCERAGAVTLNQFPEEYCSWNSLGRPAMEDPRNPSQLVPIVGAVEVEGVTLDEVCRQQGISQIDYLKLDVEGAEIRALEGAAGLLEKKAVGLLQFEISRKMLEGLNTSAKRVFDYLAAKGYECHEITPEGEIGAVVCDSPSFYENYIARPVRTAAAGALPVHFFTIVVNGKPFIEHHIQVFQQLSCPWHWHVIEGMAEQNHDTGWSKPTGGKITAKLHRHGLSTDGTTEYLDALARQFPGQITIYRKPGGAFWDGKLEMVNAPIANLSQECLLWQVDADELWTAEQVHRARKLFLSLPEKTAAFYICHYFVGRNLVTTTRNTYGNHLDYEWIRTWRFQPGDRWTSHEPPRLTRPAGAGEGRDVAAMNPVRHAETEALGLVFQHFAYATAAQLAFKETYYGYAGAVRQWEGLQAQRHFPARLADYFSWVKDATEVNTIQSQGIVSLAPDGWFSGSAATGMFSPEPKKILFARTDSIGDVVLASSMLEPLRRRFPGAQVAVLCQEHIAELFTACPHVQGIICFDIARLRQGGDYEASILAEIRAFAPDLILNSVYSRETTIEAFLLKLKGVRAIGMEGNLTNISASNRRAADALYERLIPSEEKNRTELDHHHDFLAGLGISAEKLQPVVWTTPDDEAVAAAFFKQHKLDPFHTIALFPGSLLEVKLYPRLAQALRGLTGHRFLIFGGADVAASCAQLEGQLSGPVINLAGRSTLREMAALIRRCRLFVGVDSSGAHIACATGVRNVVVLGGGHFGRFLPYSPLTSAVALPLECFHCNWQCRFSRNHCVKDIAPEVVALAIAETLARPGSRPRLFVQGDDFRGTTAQPRGAEVGQFISIAGLEIKTVRVNAQAGGKAAAVFDTTGKMASQPDAVSKPQTSARSADATRAVPRLRGDAQSAIRNPQSAIPMVSALVSTYNSERFMRGCLEDLTSQTLFAAGQLEIIVIDTASPQNERAIVEEFQKRFANIIYLRTEERETIYAAWNRGVEAARGRHLTSANTDDRHRPDALAVMAAHLEEHPETALVYSDQLVTDVPNETFAETQAPSHWDWPQYSYAELERRCMVGSQPLWRRSLHEKHGLFRPELRSAGDYEFWLRIGKDENFCRLPEILGLYYHNPNGLEMGGGHSIAETTEIRERHGLLAQNVEEFCSVPITISREELNRLPFRKVALAASSGAGFNPAKPDYNNTPVSSLRPARAYRPADPDARPVVTILTPFFNTGDIFEETARSVLGQTFQQWEWLIVNDASTAPEAERVLNRYRKADPRIKVIDQAANRGPGAARNLGVKMAAGDYIVLLDSDDLLEPTAVEKWLWHLESHPEFAFVKGWSIGFGAKNYLWNNGFHNREAFLKENLVDLTSMIRKSTFAKAGGYAEEMRHGFEDWEFWLRCASHGLWGATVPEHLDWYRRREDHSDRWTNWDSGERQRKSCAELQKKYQRLEKSFPSPQPAAIRPGTPANLDVPARNALQKTKPRVLLLLPWMTMGGADKFNLDLVEQLTGRGWEVTCATTLQGDHSWMPEFNRFTPDVFAMPNFLEVADYPRFLCYLIQSRQIDTVLISNSMMGYQLLLFLRSRFPDVTFLDYCHMEQEDWLDGGYPQVSVKSASCLDLSVVSSQHLKRWMVAKGGNPDQVEVCHTNIDARGWEPDPVIRQRVRSQLELSETHPVILYAGRVVEQKQPRVFAETMRLLREQNSDFTALVAGDGPDLPWLKEFVTQHQLTKNVRFLGGVPNQRIRELMRASDIFFLPSQWEGIALSIFEAMACGLAVVGADVGGQRELVIPGCGHLLPRGDAVSEAKAYAAVLAGLTTDLEKARALGRAARERVTKEFVLDQMGERMVALMQQARKRHAAGARPPVAPETGLATLAQIVEMSRIQRYINTALELAKKQDWHPALEIFQHVRGLAVRGHEKNLEKDMDNAIAHLKKFAGIQSSAPLVSVVIPCYNYGRLLPEAVESVLRQTFQDFEIIIVNDGSTDNTIETADRLIQKHGGKHRMRLITQPNSGQPAAARNTGIAAAAGEYVLPLDADDKIAPSFLEKTVAVLRAAPEVGVAFTHIQHFGEIQSVYATGPFEPAVLARDNVLPYCSLYRRRLWEDAGGYKLMGYEDWDFWLTLAERGCRGRLVPEPLFCYRKHGQGMLNQDNQKRERLVAQMVSSHPKLYDAARRDAARAALERNAISGAAKVADEQKEISPAPGGRKPLRITYLISSILGVTGGNQTLLRQAEEMRRRGHQVTIVTYSPKPDWFRFEMPVVQAPAGQPMASCVPPSDVVVATYFINAGELRNVKAAVKVYYAQGDQFVFGDTTMADTPQNRQFAQLSRASYLLPGIRFVPNSKNLAAAVEKLCGRRPDGILPVCTDQTIFRPLQRSVAGSRFRLLIVGPDSRGTAVEPLLFKGMQDIHDALQILSAQYPHFTPVRMSGTAPDIFARVPCEFYIAPNDEMKTVLFGTSHIHIYASHYDSCPRPPQEAMAAGCAVVCTATSGALEYCRDGENSLLVPVKSPAAIAAAVGRLIHDHPLREKLAQGGLATAREFPREREWNEWENMIYRFMDEAGKPGAATAIAARPAKAAAPIKLPACALLGHLGPARELLKQKKLAAAWESAGAAIQTRPFHPEGFLLLGEIAQAAGDGASAILCGKHARQLAPEWKPAKKFLSGNFRGVARPAWLVLPPAISTASGSAPRLSVCLIVKNEEKFLGPCLASVRGLADQIIVVDTGSSDRTVEIAQEHGAETHHFAWNDDFAAARNAALEHATGDWVLSLDADEELLPGQAQTILREMQTAGVMACRLPIIDKGREQEGRSYVPRLFRNAPGLFFLGRVHEQAFSSIEVRCKEWSLQHVLGKTTILHHGYLKEVMESRDKIARNLRLLERAVEELPGEPNLVMSLGLELVRSGRREEGVRRYWEAVELMGAQPPGQTTPELRETLLSQLTTHLIAGKEFAEVVRLWEMPAAQSGAQTASHHFGLGLACMELKRHAEAAEQMRQCLAKRGQPALSPVNTEILKAGPQHCLALCLAALGQKEAAEKAFAAALADDPASRRAGLDFARFQAEQGRPLEALKQLNSLVTENPGDAAVWQLGGQIALSRPEFLEFARDWTGEAMKHFPGHAAILPQRAEALLLTQETEAARPLWLKCHSPNSPRQVAAVVLCELLAGDCRRVFPASDEALVSQELVKWYRKLIAAGAHSSVHQLHERMEEARRVAPGFVRVWEAANKQARETLAVVN